MTETVKLRVTARNATKALFLTVHETATISQVVKGIAKYIRDTKPHWEGLTVEYDSFTNCGGWDCAKGVKITAMHVVVKAYSEMTLEELYDHLLAAKMDAEVKTMMAVS